MVNGCEGKWLEVVEEEEEVSVNIRFPSAYVVQVDISQLMV
jgi:hypothetical protein